MRRAVGEYQGLGGLPFRRPLPGRSVLSGSLLGTPRSSLSDLAAALGIPDKRKVFIITDAVPKMKRGVVVEIGLGKAAAEPAVAPMTAEARPAVPVETARQRGPRIGRRVSADELRFPESCCKPFHS
jgi:hypothetical protein